jgi:fructosamine-3-kinase
MLSKRDFEEIIKKYDPHLEILSSSKITSGNINLMYEIETNIEKIILRIIPNENEAYKIDKETYVYSIIGKYTDLPVPKILFVDKSKKTIPFSYYLMSKLPGKMLRFARLTREERLNLYEKLGAELAKIHQITFKKSGWIYKNKISKSKNCYSKPLKDWKSVFLDSYNGIKEKLNKTKNKNYGKIDKFSFINLFPEIEKILKENIKLVDIHIKPVLIHNDFTLRNILATKINNNWKITGIIDVEFSRTGHNEFELACLDHFLYDKKNILRYSDFGMAFLKGYKRKIKLSNEFERRKYLYLLISFLSLVEFEGFEKLILDNKEIKYLYNSILRIIGYFS